jgi:hypothetical protein
MCADRERQDLQRHVSATRPAATKFDQLITNHRTAAERPAQHRFIEHHPKIDRIVLNQ